MKPQNLPHTGEIVDISANVLWEPVTKTIQPKHNQVQTSAVLWEFKDDIKETHYSSLGQIRAQPDIHVLSKRKN